MFGMPDKAKIAKAFQGFAERLAAIRDQSNGVPPPSSDTLKLMDQRITNLEKFVNDLKDSM